eukprot:NODE_2897_length_1465_cov_44.576751_g2507_i0.p1 GENE.NODE_2897_length_1465_cov_44.576751_g2507_i0~~NODE_2897_length_1465_cov_44.576751_g2507_i0.p1  ORF type:complete len:425 (+),score=111.33 NODE_2897_length_1465_cov_44.576751_g2507_i0:90-1364(+)
MNAIQLVLMHSYEKARSQFREALQSMSYDLPQFNITEDAVDIWIAYYAPRSLMRPVLPALPPLPVPPPYQAQFPTIPHPNDGKLMLRAEFPNIVLQPLPTISTAENYNSGLPPVNNNFQQQQTTEPSRYAEWRQGINQARNGNYVHAAQIFMQQSALPQQRNMTFGKQWAKFYATKANGGQTITDAEFDRQWDIQYRAYEQNQSQTSANQVSISFDQLLQTLPPPPQPPLSVYPPSSNLMEMQTAEMTNRRACERTEQVARHVLYEVALMSKHLLMFAAVSREEVRARRDLMDKFTSSNLPVRERLQVAARPLEVSSISPDLNQQRPRTPPSLIPASIQTITNPDSISGPRFVHMPHPGTDVWQQNSTDSGFPWAEDEVESPLFARPQTQTRPVTGEVVGRVPSSPPMEIGFPVPDWERNRRFN